MYTLCSASKRGHLALVDELLQNKELLEKVVTGRGYIEEDCEHPLTPAIRQGNIAVIRRYLDLPGIDLVHINRAKGVTPIEGAIYHRDTDIVNMLLARGVPAFPDERKHFPPIILALLYGSIATAKALKEAGGGEGIPPHKWAEMLGCLYERLGIYRQTRDKLNRLEDVILLLQDMPLSSDIIKAVLHSKKVAHLTLLLQNRPNLAGDEFQFILHTAIDHIPKGSLLQVCQLLVDCGAPLFGVGRDKNILQFAVCSKTPTILVNYLLGCCGCPSPSTALAYASNADVAKCLINAGAEIDHVDEDGDTPLLKLLQRPFYEWKERSASVNLMDTLREFLAHGGNASYQTTRGTTPLSVATKNILDLEVIRLLAKYGAKFHPGGFESGIYYYPQTVMQTVTRDYPLEVAKVLLQVGAPVNLQDAQGRTALWHAARQMDTEVLEYLLENGAEVQSHEDCGRTALHATLGYVRHIHSESTLKAEIVARITECTRILLESGTSMWGIGQSSRRLWPGVVSIAHLQLYIDHGLDVNEEVEWDNRSYNPSEASRRFNSNGTILNYIIRKGDIDLVKYVLSAGARVDVLDDAGKSPWQFAREYNFEHLTYIQRAEFYDELRTTGIYTEAAAEEEARSRPEASSLAGWLIDLEFTSYE
ncbi:hypothetical protein VHEMI06123 [[Torrubiella] hemipterigena]|uniref:Ankyrin repeat protein n=1 Tax=[Torrubiella] hemipterigena TaxID=1531966 RepID=A0A0A1SZS2_9HYPO|nr:hypothetical protein VHEMI06123 [[Torrubiella] hemipterigena]